VAGRERAQERPERRGRRHAVVEQRGGTPGAQGVAIIDRVAVERHRRDQRHDFRVRVRRPRTIAQANRLVNQRLDPKRSGDRRRQHDPRLRDKPLVVEADRQSTRRDNQPPSLTMWVIPAAGPRLPISAAIKMLKEWEKDDKPEEGWKDLDAAKPTLKAVS
jgi:hypothetical protein